jgi:hypothetical protein
MTSHSLEITARALLSLNISVLLKDSERESSRPALFSSHASATGSPEDENRPARIKRARAHCSWTFLLCGLCSKAAIIASIASSLYTLYCKGSPCTKTVVWGSYRYWKACLVKVRKSSSFGVLPGDRAEVTWQLLVDAGQDEPAVDKPTKYALCSSSHYFSAP